MHVATQTCEFHFHVITEQNLVVDLSPVGSEGKLPYEPLTERELQVASLIMDGYLTKQVALALHIAVGTVRNHIKNIYQKLGVHSRVQLITKLLQYNLLEQSEFA